MDAIDTRGSKLGARSVTDHISIARSFLVRNGHDPARVDFGRPKAIKVTARIEHGRWLGDCPVDGCSGAELVDPEWPFLVCYSCGDGPFGVTFPKDRVAIEAALLARPRALTRNWIPGETAADLRRESAENGVE